MNMPIILLIVLSILLMPPGLAIAEDTTFTPIELDRFVAAEKAMVNQMAAGKKIIRMAAPVSFEASLKQRPEAKKMSYVYTALEMSEVDPMPVVEHRMFVESKGGHIIPVYVEKTAVNSINTGLGEEQRARFLGYHVYSYSKGPAILVVDFDKIGP